MVIETHLSQVVEIERLKADCRSDILRLLSFDCIIVNVCAYLAHSIDWKYYALFLIRLHVTCQVKMSRKV